MQIQKIREGDKEAFKEFYNSHWEKLYITAMGLVRSEELAKDFVQETFLKLWQNRTKIDPAIPPLPYLYTILKNSILNFIKREQTFNGKIAAISNHLNQGNPSPEDIVVGKELESLIHEEEIKLPTKMRRIWLMKREEYLSNGEIAQSLNISPLTVKKQISNARSILRARILEHMGNRT